MESLFPERAVINKERCTDCQRCVRSCLYNVIRVKDGRVSIGEDCRGCGICTCVCPAYQAIGLKASI